MIARVVSGKVWVCWPLILSGAALILTAGMMLLIPHESSALLLIVMSLLFGFTDGFSGFANQATLYVQTPAEDIAVASGLTARSPTPGAIFLPA